jgi:hypothetical protein
MTIPIQEEPESTVGRKPPRRPTGAGPSERERVRPEPGRRESGAAGSGPENETRERERSEPSDARGHEG